MRTHEWVRVSKVATVGITETPAQLPTWSSIELPDIGPEDQGRRHACAMVESVKTANDIYSPVSGEVVETNSAIVADPAQVNSDPYTSGWFFKVKLSHPGELDGLLSAKEYKAQIGGE